MTEHLVINYNIRGLPSTLAEIEILLQRHRPSVVDLTNPLLSSSARARGYTMYREAYAPGTLESVAILVRNDCPTAGTHILTFDVRFKTRFTFSCVYRRPRAVHTAARLLFQHAQSVSRYREHYIIPPAQTGFQIGVACDHNLAKLP